ncbi:MAG: alpha/beta hydrolase [Gemmatimonadetes bacterium]|nr:alpha/beta hydrolase [Gemmatimonadota bacterium]
MGRTGALVSITGWLAWLTFVPPVGAQEPPDSVPAGLLGRWAGAAIQNGTPSLLELDFSLDAEGRLRTELTLPYNGYDRFRYDFTYTVDGPHDGTLTSQLFGDEMRLVVDLAEAHLRGAVTEGDSVTARVHLQKVVRFEFPTIDAAETRFPAGQDTLAGVLYSPLDADRPPVVLLVTGRGYGTRHEMSNWGRLLARQGIAALAFDGRGTGGSTGDNDSASAEDRFDDVRGALDFLAHRNDLGPVGLLGNSAAGWIVPTIAAERDDVRFVVTLVGPAESLADQQGHVTTAFMRASGEVFTEAEYEEAFEYQRRTVVLSQEGASWADFQRINRPARTSSWAEHALIPDSLDAPDLDYFRRRIGFTKPRWEQVRVPVLAVYGEDDVVVPPEDNVPLLQAALAGNEDVTIVVLPGADHALARPDAWVGEGEWPDRYYRPWTRSPFLFETVLDWIASRFVSPESDAR